MTRGLSTHSRYLHRLISYHEAGHAVVARKLGVEIASVDMTPDDDRLANVWTPNITWLVEQTGGDRAALVRGLYTDLMVALAGMAAQELAGYRKNDDDCIGDINNAICYAMHLACVEAGLPLQSDSDELQEFTPYDPRHMAGVAIVERAGAEILAMLQDNWQAIERVAGALRKYDRLTQADLDRAIGHCQRRRQ
ncbi:MAG TPA: hypothetical protein VGJ20_31735 [Xanthobacteraceae bacterium]